MMLTLEVLLDGVLAGHLHYTPERNSFDFHYAANWQQLSRPYPLSPRLAIPLLNDEVTSAHSVQVRFFFENLLPEGQALDDAAATYKVSKSNLIGLISALGRETAGAVALRVIDKDATGNADKSMLLATEASVLRPLTYQELSSRIAARPDLPFSVWDGKVRLSIAGFQDKIAVLKDGDNWFMVDAGPQATTLILKPEPLSRRLAGLTSNEFFCMRLARAVGMPVAEVRLLKVPEPVLEIARFDREQGQGRVRRRHIVDGCQVLGIPPGMKYERPYGDNPDVRNIRDGASLPRLFRILDECPNPAAQRLQLLRWTIFQVLIGNMDAHAKNVSFFCDENGLRLTPTYDLVSTLSFERVAIADSFAMAIGDAFKEPDITPYEWAHFAHLCGVPRKLLIQQLKRMTTKLVQQLDKVAVDVVSEGANHAYVEHICDVVRMITERHVAMIKMVGEVEEEAFYAL